jgi:hypothetical protein
MPTVLNSFYKIWLDFNIRFNSTNSPFHIFSFSLSGMLDEMAINITAESPDACE